eukprot:7897508-Karenia_brevis.AAC.1
MQNRASITSLFAGDWFLARYAGNYFAKSFLPTGKQCNRSGCTESHRVCMHCWHEFRELHFEDEQHVLLKCPRYDLARAQLLSSLSNGLASKLCLEDAKVSTLFSSPYPANWSALGCFTAR